MSEAIPEWVRKSMLFTMVFLAFKNDPSVQELIHPYEPTQEEIDKEAEELAELITQTML